MLKRLSRKVLWRNQVIAPLTNNIGVGNHQKTECRSYLEGPRFRRMDFVLEELVRPKKLVFYLGKGYHRKIAKKSSES